MDSVLDFPKSHGWNFLMASTIARRFFSILRCSWLGLLLYAVGRREDLSRALLLCSMMGCKRAAPRP